MSDPRDVAQDKKVHQQKLDEGKPLAPEGAAHAPQPGKKTATVHETPTEVPTSSHATSQHHHDRHTGHVEEPPAVQAEVNAKENATDH